ncbi:P-loop containing nucleoside triphosphate hydrolase protein [Mycena epipterygia]|nr:P-loop containing nucleoside triphosphate hydrolase protein [Mycena epipterygia]
MLSFLTDFLSSLSFVSSSPADLPLQPQYCKCRIYPNLSTNLDKLCITCGNLKFAGNSKPEYAPSITPRRPQNTPPAASQRVHPPTGRKAVQYINKKLEASFASIPDDPVLICRNGSLAIFENGESLRDYQARDVQRMCDREAEGASTILAYDMGLGKTVASIALVCSRRSAAPNAFRTTLVVAPSVGILQHWQAEIKRFAPKLRVLLYHKEGRNKDPRLLDVTLLTLAELRNQYTAYMDENILDENKFKLYTGTFHRVIIDEAHTLRNPETANANACWALKKTHALLLTGTPAQNTPRDLFSLFKFIDVKSAGLNDLATFDARVTDPYNEGEIVKPTELLVSVLSDCMIYRPKGPGFGLIELPTLHEAVRVLVKLTPAEREVYRYIKFVHPFKSQWAKAIRLRQAVDHPALLTKALHRGDVGSKPDETSDQMRVLLDNSPAEANEIIAQDIPLGTLPPCLAKHSAIFEPTYMSSKFRALWKILKSLPAGEKAIVFSHFLTNLDMTAELLSKNNISFAKYDGRMGPSERAEALNQIRNDKHCTVLLVSIMAGGTGVDIPACNHVVLIEPWWNPYVEDQAISRAHRIGQVREVRVYKLLVENSIEDSIVKTQDAKREVIGGLLSLCTVPDVDEMRKWLA